MRYITNTSGNQLQVLIKMHYRDECRIETIEVNASLALTDAEYESSLESITAFARAGLLEASPYVSDNALDSTLDIAATHSIAVRAESLASIP